MSETIVAPKSTNKTTNQARSFLLPTFPDRTVYRGGEVGGNLVPDAVDKGGANAFGTADGCKRGTGALLVAITGNSVPLAGGDPVNCAAAGAEGGVCGRASFTGRG